MKLGFFIISIILTSGFIGVVFAQTGLIPHLGQSQQIDAENQLIPLEFTQEEIDAMKNKTVLLQTHEGTLTIQLFPEDAPNHVHNFLTLVESGYYDGMVFHRIIPGFMIQTGDPNTKDPENDRGTWGTGGPGYQMDEEFNTLKHVRGIVSMARGQHIDTAGSQFFIVHQDSLFLDGKYTAFGRIAPGLPNNALDIIASLPTDNNDAPIPDEVQKATIIQATVLDASFGIAEPDRHTSIVTQALEGRGIEVYTSPIHGVKFDLPYRWEVNDYTSGGDLRLVIEPGAQEHNAQMLIEQTGFVPQILVGSENRQNWEIENDELNTGFFSIQNGDEPKLLSNYIFENGNGEKAHLIVSTQNLETDTETIQFKIIQIHFNNSEKNYSIIYVNMAEWFKYEANSFRQTVNTFQIEIDGKLQPVNFAESPVFKQVFTDSLKDPEPESLPPVRIGGCLIATASYGTELAPQVQLLREIRDNTVLQTQSGTSFMNGFNHFYYSFSPTISDYERENPIFKEAVKLTLAPLLASLTLLQYTDIDSEHEMLGYGIGLILLNVGMYFIAPAILITKIRSFYKLQ